ncbi:phosphatidylserine/phosphatidylglycerophosphate/cardiolipin synthase family protein [Nocardioides sp.]|uniref:phospholipase D-like domain-containing protein n=1 Tax=Nocardioides sp. TaxID=35761 RepID=UPI00356AC6BC
MNQSSTRAVQIAGPEVPLLYGPQVPTLAASAKESKKRYRVSPGITLSNPLNGTRDDINAKVTRAINHTFKKAKIRMASWNFDSWAYVGALTAAHKRGVSVRLIMSRQMANAQGSRGPYAALRRNLMGSGNGSRPANRRSWFKTCDHSCRGKGGAMHSKFFIFSQSGKSKKIVMNTSANLTAAAKRVQWNDLYTAVGRDITYRAYNKVFRQMPADTKQNYHQYQDKGITLWFYPAPGQPDIVMGMLNQVQCDGAKKAGVKGKTSIRVAQDVFNNKRGETIARKLLALHRSGCSVRVVYSQAVGASRSIIKRLPNNHLVQDRDGDCSYDRYLHAKILAISGNYGGNPSERIVLNGSANWSATAVKSDEQGMIIDRDSAEKKYAKWVNEMYNIHLKSAPCDPTLAAERVNGRMAAFDPYAEMEH